MFHIIIAKLKRAWKSKTVAFGLLLTLFSYAEDHLHSLQAYIPPKIYPLVTFIIGMIVLALRFVTTKPLEDK